VTSFSYQINNVLRVTDILEGCNTSIFRIDQTTLLGLCLFENCLALGSFEILITFTSYHVRPSHKICIFSNTAVRRLDLALRLACLHKENKGEARENG
jgi:hypothetical protein